MNENLFSEIHIDLEFLEHIIFVYKQTVAISGYPLYPMKLTQEVVRRWINNTYDLCPAQPEMLELANIIIQKRYELEPLIAVKNTKKYLEEEFSKWLEHINAR